MQHTNIRARHSDCKKAGAGGILGYRSILVLVALPVQALVLALVLAVLLEKHCTTGFEGSLFIVVLGRSVPDRATA